LQTITLYKYVQCNFNFKFFNTENEQFFFGKFQNSQHVNQMFDGKKVYLSQCPVIQKVKTKENNINNCIHF